MGNHIRVQLLVPEILPRYVNNHLGQLSLAIRSWVGAITDQPKGGDTLRLWIKNRCGSSLGDR